MTETSFTIDELEELYALFKVSFKVKFKSTQRDERTSLTVLGLLNLSVRWSRGSIGPQHAQGRRQSRENKAVLLNRKTKSITSTNLS